VSGRPLWTTDIFVAETRPPFSARLSFLVTDGDKPLPKVSDHSFLGAEIVFAVYLFSD
jgi:hypothetical protein